MLSTSVRSPATPRRLRSWARRSLAAGLLAAGLAGCATDPGVSRGNATADDAFPEVLATIGNERITMADVRERFGAELDQLDIQYRRARHAVVENAVRHLVRERIFREEARKQGTTVDELILAAAQQPIDPTEEEIQAWYVANQTRLGGRSLDELRPQIREFLRNERLEAAVRSIEERLMRERSVTIELGPFQFAFDHTGAPALGPENAPVTLTEFSDFECPYCARFAPTLKQLQEAYGDRLRVVYRQFPIPGSHPNAFKAAEASLCAHEQGRFWEMHDLMFQEQHALTVDDLKEKAGRLGLDRARFDECLDSGRHAEQVRKDMTVGAQAGVSGTPTLFLNGALLGAGALPYEEVARAIDQELERVQRRGRR